MKRLLALLLLLLPMTAHADGLTVFAAASLTDALHDIDTLWRAQGHKPLSFNFAASSTLAEQIEHGAPADVFASADELWMDKLQADRRIRPQTRFDLVGNTLVLVERREGLKPVKLKQAADLTALLGKDGRLAVGDPAHVPAGIYARQALQKLGLWDSVQNRLAPAESVRAALLLVERGEAPAGIVYATDVKVSPTLGIAAVLPADSHDPIRYPVAATRPRNARETPAFLQFLKTDAVQDVFIHYGFTKP